MVTYMLLPTNIFCVRELKQLANVYSLAVLQSCCIIYYNYSQLLFRFFLFKYLDTGISPLLRPKFSR